MTHDLNGKESHVIFWEYPEIYDRAKQTAIQKEVAFVKSWQLEDQQKENAPHAAQN